jgi:hypothetical protein
MSTNVMGFQWSRNKITNYQLPDGSIIIQPFSGGNVFSEFFSNNLGP